MKKAYKLGCPDADHGNEVVFAESSKEARKMHDLENCDCEFIRRTAHRELSCDKYSPGPMTIEDYLAEGWYWRCSGCDKQVWGEDSGHVVTEGYVFCGRQCLEKTLREHERDWSSPDCHESMHRFADAMRKAVTS